MNRAALVAILAPTSLALAACGTGFGADGNLIPSSGEGEQRSYSVTNFTGVTLNGVDNIDVRTGPYSVVAEGDSSILDRIEVRKNGDTLNIGRKNGASSGFKGKHARIIVTMPQLASAHIAGSGNMTVAEATGEFKGTVAGSGNLTVDKLSSSTAKLAITGSGNIALSNGSAETLKVTVAGTGSLAAPKSTFTTAKISIAGSGNVNTRVTDSADISLIGSGDVELTGGAKCTVNKLGTGSANCG